jgi:iron complex transport system ATP-binding protein
MIQIRDVGYRVGPVTILSSISVAFPAERFNVILGPNGAGKSTLLRIAAGLVQPTGGVVSYAGEDIAGVPIDALARSRSVLSQHVGLPFALRVDDVVMIGRYPHFDRVPTAKDRAIVEEALALVGMVDRRAQPYPTLSGGEQQKVHLARVLAQIWSDDTAARPTYLFLDEPTSDLDVRYQLHILDVARQLLHKHCTVVAILHDINTALDYGDHFVVVDRGRIAVATDTRAALSADLFERVFGVHAERVGGAMWKFQSIISNNSGAGRPGSGGRKPRA